MKVAIAGGGTGGHIYPAVAVVEYLRSVDDRLDVIFVGTRRGLESGIVPSLGYKIHRIVAEPLPLKKNVHFILALFCAAIGFVQSFFILLLERPNVVVGTGGYASGPFVFAASLVGVPTLLIEPNVIPGRTTMLLARLVDRVALGFQESVRYFRKGTNLRVTGIPVRHGLLTPTRDDGIRRFGLDPARKTIFIFGGSRGAHSINQAFVDAAKALQGKHDLQFVIQTGEADYRWASQALSGLDLSCRAYPYIDDIGYAYRASDLVVSRAGASTLTELAAFGLPSILVPYPHATLSHQAENAKLMEARGAAVVIRDRDLSGSVLAEAILSIIYDPRKVEMMSKGAGEAGNREASREVGTSLVELAKGKGRLSKLATVLGDICSAR